MFKSYFWGGFECCYAQVVGGETLDLLKATKHDVYCREDYHLLKSVGIFTAREGLAWSQIDNKGIYNFSRFERMMEIAKEEQIELVWDLNHFDLPKYLDPFSDEFVVRFGEYAKRAVEVIRKYNKGTIYIVPINEISFWSLMGAEWGRWAPFATQRGFEFKKQLALASIRAMDEIVKTDSEVKFIQVDPIMRRVAKDPFNKNERRVADGFVNVKFQTWDMLSGKLLPEIGGDEKYLDIIGANYYIYNQEWVVEDKKTGEMKYEPIPWKGRGRVGIKEMLFEVYERYGRPMVISETGAWGMLRPRWWRRALMDSELAAKKLPIHGICAYPVVDRPDWDDGHLTNSGLWDFLPHDKELKRIPHEKTLNLVRRYILNNNGRLAKAGSRSIWTGEFGDMVEGVF